MHNIFKLQKCYSNSEIYCNISNIIEPQKNVYSAKHNESKQRKSRSQKKKVVLFSFWNLYNNFLISLWTLEVTISSTFPVYNFITALTLQNIQYFHCAKSIEDDYISEINATKLVENIYQHSRGNFIVGLGYLSAWVFVCVYSWVGIFILIGSIYMKSFTL